MEPQVSPNTGEATAAAPRLYTVTMLPGGAAFEAADSEALLQSAEAAGFAWPSSCRNGTCRTCIALVAEGRVVHQVEWPGLSAEEKREGWILPCVAHPASDLLMQFPAI